MLMNVEVLATNNYKLSFYVPSMVGALDANGYYTLTNNASPFVVWQVDSPDGSTNQWRRSEMRNGATNATTVTYNRTTYVWTLTQGTGNEARIETRAISTNILSGVTNRIETQEVRTSAGAVSDRTVEVYRKFPWGYELVVTTNAPGTANLVTSFGYGTDSGSYDYRQLVFTQYPDGFWERRVYADLDVYGNSLNYWVRVPPGALWRIIQPWKDSSTNADIPDSVVTQFSYESDDGAGHTYGPGTYGFEKMYGSDPFWSNKWVPQSLLSLYAESATFIDDECSGGVTITEDRGHGGRDYYGADDEYQLSTYGPYYGRVSGQRYSLVKGWSCITSYDYQYGKWNSTNHTFTVSTTETNDVRQVIYHGNDGYSGDPISIGDSGMGIYTVYLDPFQSTKEVKVIDGGNLAAHETYVYTGGYANYALIDQVFYERDCLGHATNVYRRDPDTLQTRTLYKADWTGTNTWPADLKQSTTEESGTQVILTYDSLKRLKTQTKLGTTASGYPSQADVVTSLGYDAAGRILTNAASAGGLTQQTIASFDYAGRLLSTTTPDALSTSFSYVDGGRQTNITYSSGATMVTRNYLDRRIASITGTAVTNQYYDYSLNDWDKEDLYPLYSVGDGFGPANATTITFGATGSSRWVENVTDRRNQLVEEKAPAFNSSTPLSTLHYIGYYSLPLFVRKSAIEDEYGLTGFWYTRFEYDSYLQQSRQYVWDSLDWQDTASTSRMTSNSWYYATDASGHWLKVAEEYSYLTNYDGTPTLIQSTKERLTGFGSNDVSETLACDALNNITATNVTVDFLNKKVTTTVDFPNSSLNAIQISLNGLVQTETTPTVATATWHYYDALGREIAVKDPLGFIIGTKYSDTTGQIIARTNQIRQVTSYQYYAPGQSNAGLLYCETGPTGKNTFYKYNDRGQVTHKWGDVPYPEQRLYSQYGEMTNLCTYRAGSGWSNPAWPTSTVGQADVTQWFYDEPTGLLTTKTDASGKSVIYSYYNNHMPKTRTWARPGNITATNIYNLSNGDLLSIAYSDGTTNVTYSDYDRRGLPCQVTDARGTITLAYDLLGRLTAESGVGGDFNGITVVNHYNTVYGKDYAQVQISGQSNYEFDYGYDSYGRLGNASYGVYSGFYGYVANSDLLWTTTSKNNGITELTTTRAWEYGSRLQSIQNKVGSSAVSSHNLVYDGLNRRTRATQQDNSTWVYDYNNRDELVSGNRFWADLSPASGQQFGYVFDNIGNRIASMSGGDVNGTNLRTTSYSANNVNEYSNITTPGYEDVLGMAWATNNLTVNGGATDRKGEYFHKEITIGNGSGPVWQSVQVTNNGVQVTNGYVLFAPYNQSPTYDYDGNLFADGLWTYTWDAENRLTKVESVTTLPNAAKRKLEFGYDHQGRRIWSKISTNNGSYVVSRNTRFVYDGWNLVAELNATNNAPQRTYLWGNDLSGTLDGAGGIGGLVAIRDHGAGTYHFTCYDGNGNIMALVNAADQSVSAQYEYSPFGELIRATGPMAKSNPFRFSTKYWDEESGLVAFPERIYSPALGRWTNRDIAEEEAGINLFALLANNPVNDIDPLGRMGTLADTDEAVTEGEAMETDGAGAVGRAASKMKDTLDMLQDLDDLRAAVMSMDDPSGALLQIQSLAGELLKAKKAGNLAGGVDHHLTPQMLKKLQPQLAGEVDKFTSALSERLHRRLHTGKGFGRGGIWNGLWKQFVGNKGGKITGAEMGSFMNQMRKYFGLDGLPVKPY